MNEEYVLVTHWLLYVFLSLSRFVLLPPVSQLRALSAFNLITPSGHTLYASLLWLPPSHTLLQVV